MERIRLFLLVEFIGFAAAALLHSGVLIASYAHVEARTAESIIAVALLIGLGLSWTRPAWTRSVGIGVQAFALLGTLVGLFTIAIGVGPRTTLDLAFHASFVFMLVWGLITAMRTRYEDTDRL